MTILRWLLGLSGTADYVPNWTQVRADRHAAETAHMLLGWAGPAKVAGNKRHEAFWAAHHEEDESGCPR